MQAAGSARVTGSARHLHATGRMLLLATKTKSENVPPERAAATAAPRRVQRAELRALLAELMALQLVTAWAFVRMYFLCILGICYAIIVDCIDVVWLY